MAEILPRFRREMLAIQDERRIAKIILEAGEVESERGTLLRSSADGHRRDRRRGLPMISKGISGTQPGTDPLAELIRKENRRRRH